MYTNTHNYRPILGIDTFKCIFLWFFYDFLSLFDIWMFRTEASTAASCSEHVDASKKVPQTTSRLLRGSRKSTAFLENQKIRYYRAAPFFQPVSGLREISCCFLWPTISSIRWLFENCTLRLSILWPAGSVGFCMLESWWVGGNVIGGSRDFLGHNLSVFGEMSMKWNKFGSKYARLLFLKAPAGNNLQGAFSARRRKKGEEVPHLDTPGCFRK